MKFYPGGEFQMGSLYFRDTETIESTNTLTFDAKLDDNRGLLLFEFEGCNLAFDLNSLTLIDIIYQPTNIHYTNNVRGHSCTLSYFFLQNMIIGDETIVFLSGVFDIAEEHNYRIFRMNGYFSMQMNTAIGWKRIIQ